MVMLRDKRSLAVEERPDGAREFCMPRELWVFAANACVVRLFGLLAAADRTRSCG